MIVKIIVCIIIPLLLFSLLVENKVRRIVLFLCIGTICCFLAYLLNTYILNNTKCNYFFLTTNIAPIIEETLKFIPILIMSIIINKFKIKDSILPIAFVLGIGFSITENFYMLAEYQDTATVSWMILRGLGSGLMHSLSASIIALGIFNANKYPKLKSVGIIASLFLAILFHGFYNCLVNNDGILKYVGVIIPIITYFMLFIIYRKDLFKDFINEK